MTLSACSASWLGCQLRLRLRLRFQLREPRERFTAIRAAHLELRLQTRAACGPLRPAEDRTAQIVAELDAAHARRLAVRHARNRTRNRRRDTARAAIGTARVAVDLFAVQPLIHVILPELKPWQRVARPALCHCLSVRPFYAIGVHSRALKLRSPGWPCTRGTPREPPTIPHRSCP